MYLKGPLMKRIFVSLTLLFTLNLAASTILLDFGTSQTAPTLGGTWNSLQTDTLSGLFYSEGSAATGISVTFTNLNTSSTNNGIWGAGDKDWVDGQATADYVWRGSGGSGSITISGLNDALTYDVSLVAARNGGTNRTGTYTVGDFTTTDESSSSNIDVATSFTNGTLLNWTAIAPTSGSIVLTGTPGSGQTVFFNAAQITAIPEPATLTLAGISLMVMYSVQRKRRHNTTS